MSLIEPEDDNVNSLLVLVRMPEGTRLKRRFLNSDSIEVFLVVFIIILRYFITGLKYNPNKKKTKKN